MKAILILLQIAPIVFFIAMKNGSSKDISAVPEDYEVNNYKLHRNGVTVLCENEPEGKVFSLDSELYRVVYTKNDAKKYAEKACTSNMTDMSNMRFGKNFNLDISHWDTHNVRDMTFMFKDARNFNQDISHWDVRNVEKMYGMFYNAYTFNQDISGWNVRRVYDFNNMFYGASYFNKILANWCVNKVSKKVEGFADKSGFEDMPGFHPNWGHCP